jgi:hypothetical protein
VITLLAALSSILIQAWCLSGAGATLSKWVGAQRPLAFFRGVLSELRPFYLPAVVALYVAGGIKTGRPFRLGDLFGVGIQLACWFAYKDDGDDRWKRRREKLAEKVAESGGKLVVVPVGAS